MGISTECAGKDIKAGLAINKENYGSEYTINSTFIKELAIE